VSIEFGFDIIHWNVNKNSGIQVDQYLCILLCVRVCGCAYTNVLGQMIGLMDSLMRRHSLVPSRLYICFSTCMYHLGSGRFQ